ncbi:MAG: peptidylprolyl isomerase [Pontibacterium sp.]
MLFILPSQARSGTLVTLETNLGAIHLELNEEKAPITVANFLSYVDEGYYDNLIFHRVIAGFMIQGGGFTQTMEQKTTKAPIRNEASNGLKNLAGTISMARTQNPDSATSQFFISSVDNAFLDPGPRGAGYAVFGKVVKGMEIVRQISRVATTRVRHFRDVPKDPVIILRAYRNAK